MTTPIEVKPAPSAPPAEPVAPAAPKPEPATVDLKRENLPSNYPRIEKIEALIANASYFQCFMDTEVLRFSSRNIKASDFSSELAYRKYFNRLLAAKQKCAAELGQDASHLPAPLPEDTSPLPKPSKEEVDLSKERLPAYYPTVDELDDLLDNSTDFNCLIEYKLHQLSLSNIDRNVFSSGRAYRKYYNKVLAAKQACYDAMNAASFVPSQEKPSWPQPLPEDVDD